MQKIGLWSHLVLDFCYFIVVIQLLGHVQLFVLWAVINLYIGGETEVFGTGNSTSLVESSGDASWSDQTAVEGYGRL